MIQDIYPHRLYNEFHPGRTACPENPVFVFDKGSLLIRLDGKLASLPKCREFPEDAELIFLFSVDEEDCFLLRGELRETPEGCSLAGMRDLRKLADEPQELIFAAYTAWQLARWYNDNVYCGTCGTKTGLSKTERALICPKCGRVIYPRIIPAVIVGVTNGDEIVLTRYAGREHPYNALIAGFTEIGETFEQTVEREVMEEVGLRVKNIRYYKSQPWGIVDDILAGFYCEVDGDPTIRMDANELKSALWTRREDIELQPDEYSLTNEMMREFKEGRQ